MRALAVVAVFALAWSCQAPPPPEPEFTEADRQAIAAEIERSSNEMFQDGRPEAVEAMLAFWSPAADSYYVTEPAVFAQGVRVLSTMQDMRQFFDPSGWNRQSTNIATTSSSVAILSPDHAVQVLEGRFSVTNMEGETGPEYPLSMTGVWVKEDGTWKVVHWHQSWTNTPIESEPEG